MAKKYYSKKHKEQKVKKKKLYIYLYSIIFIAIIFSIGYFSRYDNFEFNTINISGLDERHIEEMELIIEDSLESTMFMWLISRGTPLTYDKGGIRDRLLSEFPKIDRLVISPEGDGVLDVQVSERGPYSLWCTNDCYLVDILGFVYEQVDNQYIGDGLLKIKDNLNNVSVGELVVEDYKFDEIKELVKDINDYGYQVEEFEITFDDHYYLHLIEGTILKFTPLKDIDIQIDNFKSVFNEQNNNLDLDIYEYIDLRFDNKVYTKMVSSEEETIEASAI